MRQKLSLLYCSRFLLVLTGLLLAATARAQSGADETPEHIWTTDFDITTAPAVPVAPTPKANRIQLFRIVPGFLTDPVGLDTDDPNDQTPDNGPDWVQVSMGIYNPYFDFRRPGDPGGVGYYKLHSQVQVLDTGKTGFVVAMQAVTPAGLDQDGVQDGPTVVSPSLCLFHTLDNGTGFQSFVGKNMNLAASSLSQPVHHNLQYGFALQKPVLETGPDKIGSFYLFVEALGRYHFDPNGGPTAVWEMVPGIHWHMTDNVWLSGGVLLPVNDASTPPTAHLWQLTCSFQF